MKRWAAGVITISVTFVVTVLFVYVVSLALAKGQDSVRLPLLIVAAVVGLLGAIAFVVVAFSLYGLINGQEPLGLPEGSVRALLALLILGIFASMTIFFFGAMRTPPPANTTIDMTAANDLAKQVLTILGTLLTAIASFYFGSQSATSAVKAAMGANPFGGGGPAGGGGGGQPGGGGGGGRPGGGGGGGGGKPGGGGPATSTQPTGGAQATSAQTTGAAQPDAGSQPDSGSDAIDVATTRDLPVSWPLTLKRRVVPDEKTGMEKAD
jgi:uncharacterized membrane protein